LTKADLEHSQTAYADLLSSAKAYRLALASLSTAASAFGSALESCARLKEARADALHSVFHHNANSISSGHHSGAGGILGAERGGSGAGAGGGGGGIGGTPGVGGAGGGLGGSLMSNSFSAKATCTADTLLTVAGLQHLVANHHQILSETVYRSFEVPLLHELDKWRAAVDDEEEGYASAVAAQSREIRRLEKEGLKLHKQRRRDVAKFRSHLVELTTKLDGLTTMHGEHARTLLRESQETSARIVDASCSLVRAEVDIFESLARKGWTGGGLEDVLEKGVDLFANDEDDGHLHHGGIALGMGMTSGKGGGGGVGVGDEESSKLFSILPPKSILADSSSGGGGGNGSGSDTLRLNRADSLLAMGDNDRYQSLAGVVSDHHSAVAAVVGAGKLATTRERVDRDTDSVFSEFNRSRGVRPFSPQPQPLSLNPEDLLAGLENGISPAQTPPSGSGSGSDRRRTTKTEDDDDDDETEAEGETQEETLRLLGSRSTTITTKTEESETEDEEAHPWKNEGLRRQRRGTESTTTDEASRKTEGVPTSIISPTPLREDEQQQLRGASWSLASIATRTDDGTDDDNHKDEKEDDGNSTVTG